MRDEEHRERYKEKRREAKRAVREAKRNAWSKQSRDLTSSEGRNKMFKVAKQMQKDRKDIQDANFVKDKNGIILIKEEQVREKWKQYFDTLLNDENNNEIEDVNMVAGPIEDIKEAEVEKAVKSMKNRKAPCPSGMTSDMIKKAGKTGIKELTEVFQRIVREEKSPKEWRDNLTVPLHKGKGDALQCRNHRGLRILEHGMKIWEMILEQRLRKIVKISNCQFSYMNGRLTIDAIFIVRHLQEKYTRKNRKLCHVFIDLEKAFNSVPRRAIRWAL